MEESFLTLTGGIQDIAAILPLLDTYTRISLRSSSTYLAIFGSLGVVIAGLKTLAACFLFGDIEGARILGNMGFELQGENR